MKHLFTLLILLHITSAFAQNVPANLSKAMLAPDQNKTTAAKDTIIEKDTTKENQEPQYFYLSLNTDVFVNTRGGVAKRFSPALEFGRTYGIFDIGLATGRVSSLGSMADSSHYVEFRPTINIFSKGRFNEGLCLGGGYVFGAKQGLMTEICNSINFNITEIWAVAVVQGFYYFDGTNDSRGTQYMGFSLTYNFLRKHTTNIRRKRKAIVNDN